MNNENTLLLIKYSTKQFVIPIFKFTNNIKKLNKINLKYFHIDTINDTYVLVPSKYKK